MCNDKVTLLKINGEIFENVLANVQDKIVFVPGSDVPIDEGDQFVRYLPHGRQEFYEVINPKYYVSTGGIESHYQVEVKKVLKSNERSKGSGETGHTIHIEGNNSPVTINSNDNYININTNKINDESVFEELREFILKNPVDENKEKLLASIDEMDKTKGTPAYTKAYKSFMKVAKDCVSIIGPFIPYLTNHLN